MILGITACIFGRTTLLFSDNHGVDYLFFLYSLGVAPKSALNLWHASGETAMFALLAMVGDMGGAIGHEIVGNISQSFGDDMQKGMLAGCVFPLVLVISVFIVRRNGRTKRE